MTFDTRVMNDRKTSELRHLIEMAFWCVSARSHQKMSENIWPRLKRGPVSDLQTFGVSENGLYSCSLLSTLWLNI